MESTIALTCVSRVLTVLLKFSLLFLALVFFVFLCLFLGTYRVKI